MHLFMKKKYSYDDNYDDIDDDDDDNDVDDKEEEHVTLQYCRSLLAPLMASSRP